MRKHRQPVGRDGGGKRSFDCVLNNTNLLRRIPPLKADADCAQLMLLRQTGTASLLKRLIVWLTVVAILPPTAATYLLTRLGLMDK